MFPDFTLQRRVLRFCLLLVSFVVLLTSYQSQTRKTAADIILSYKGNMGVLISSSNQAVLIDGLHEYYRPDYLPSQKEELAKLFSRKEPYTNVKMVLFSHYHRDHYSALLSKRFLQTAKENLVVGAPQVVDSLPGGQTINAWNKNRIIYNLQSNDLSVQAFDVRHTYQERHAKVQNIAYLVSIGEKKILHIGDADTDAAGFKPFEAASIDVLIAPLWFLTGEKGIYIITKMIKPKVVIATHISPNESRSFDEYKIPGVQTYFFRTINQAVQV